MRPDFFGDSYDIVKRYFCETLQILGYEVYIDPMFSGDWLGREEAFYKFLGVRPYWKGEPTGGLTALFLDPDTGVNERGGTSHISFSRLVREANSHNIVFAFDQAFQRAKPAQLQVNLQHKLQRVIELGVNGFYYASHAHFLFISREQTRLDQLRARLMERGLPATRLVGVSH